MEIKKREEADNQGKRKKFKSYDGYQLITMKFLDTFNNNEMDYFCVRAAEKKPWRNHFFLSIVFQTLYIIHLKTVLLRPWK